MVILAAGMYALTLRGEPGNPTASDFKDNLDQNVRPFELSPERGRFAHIMALGDYGRYDLTLELAEVAYPDVGYYQGKFYSFFAPGLAYMAVPFYQLGKTYNLSQVFTFGFVAVVSILSLVFLFLIARHVFRLPIWASLLAMLIFGFGSTAWSYATTLYQHQVTTFFLLSSFYLVWRFRQRKPGGVIGMAVAGLFLGTAITIDYPNALLTIPIIVYSIISAFDIKSDEKKTAIGLRLSAAVALLAFVGVGWWHVSHNATYYGGWNRLAGGLVGYKYLKEQNLIESDSGEVRVEENVAPKNVVGFFAEQKFPRGFAILLFSTDRGLFLYSPIFLLSIFGIVLAVKRRAIDLEKGVLLALVCFVFFLYSSWGDPWGGWAFGPRYLIPALPVLSLFAAWFLASTRHWLWRAAALVLFAYSSAVAFLGAMTTNAIPPKIEAVPLGTGYNFLRNWEFFADGRSGSFVYNTWLSSHISLLALSMIVIYVLIACYAFVLFLLPGVENDD